MFARLTIVLIASPAIERSPSSLIAFAILRSSAALCSNSSAALSTTSAVDSTVSLVQITSPPSRRPPA